MTLRSTSMRKGTSARSPDSQLCALLELEERARRNNEVIENLDAERFKQGMMQELLTGRTRLVAPNEAEMQA